jgi:hypothetical protein
MTAGKDWEYECMSHSKLKLDCSAVYYRLDTLDTTMTLLTNPAYFSDRENIRNHSPKAFPRMMRNLYRMLDYVYNS